MSKEFDAVVLAGGTAHRLGGVSKADVLLSGRRLLDHALDATTGARQVVVVAPETVRVPPGVRRTLEDPPLGGPVAGIAAGLAALDEGGQGAAPLLLVLSCDSPGAASAVPRLLAASDAPGTDGACLRSPAGRDQWLTAVYRTAALRRRLADLAQGTLRDVPVRELVRSLRLWPVLGTAREVTDVDTWEDLRRLEGHFPTG